MTEVGPEQHFAALRQKIDGFFAEVFARHRSDMQCASGCYDCCKTDLSITLVEAAAVARHLADASAEELAALQAGSGVDGYCAALGSDGRCRIYAARPLVCRSHGVPIRRREKEGALPVVDSCFRNFVGDALERVAPTDQLDQVTLSTMLAAIDAAFADEVGAERGTRLRLAEVLAAPDELFDID